MKYKIVNLQKYSTIKIGPIKKILIIDRICKTPKKYFIIGGASNILISENPPPLAKLSKNFNYIRLKSNNLIVGGATKATNICSFSKKNNIANFEFLSKLPGTLGGLIKMNAGLLGYCISDSLIGIKTSKGLVLKDDISFYYRNTNIKDIIFEATFYVERGFNLEKIALFDSIRDKQPKLPSIGSCFKNPKGYFAGELIEKVGLKGYRIGGVAFSKQHANFLVNIENGKYDDALKLIDMAQKRVLEAFNIKLEREVHII